MATKGTTCNILDNILIWVGDMLIKESIGSPQRKLCGGFLGRLEGQGLQGIIARLEPQIYSLQGVDELWRYPESDFIDF